MSAERLGTTDVHTHASGTDLYNFLTRRFPTTQSVRDLVLKAKLNHVKHLVVFPMPSPLYFSPVRPIGNQPWQKSGLEKFPYEIPNTILLDETEAYGEGMILPFMAIHPSVEITEQVDFLEGVARKREIYGLKLHTRATDASADSLSDSPFTRFLIEHDLPILIHASSSYEVTAADHIVALAERHPEIRICVAHLADWNANLLSRIGRMSNVYVDCAPFSFLCRTAAEKGNASATLFATDYTDPVRALVDLHEALPGKLLWGTDEPWTALSGSDGKLTFRTSYEEECKLLDGLSKRGYSHVKESISRINTALFLFGDRPDCMAPVVSSGA